MSEIDAAELARLRADVTAALKEQYPYLLMEKTQIIALLDALEKAQGECDSHRAGSNAKGDYLQRAIAERDAARALLGEALPWVGHMSDNPDIGLRARIAKELAK